MAVLACIATQCMPIPVLFVDMYCGMYWWYVLVACIEYIPACIQYKQVCIKYILVCIGSIGMYYVSIMYVLKYDTCARQIQTQCIPQYIPQYMPNTLYT